MKKTLITLMSLMGISVGADYTYSSPRIGEDSKASVHGFSFTLTSTLNAADSNSPTIEELGNLFMLNGFTLSDRSDSAGDSVAFGLLVLDSNDVIVGFSNETTTPCDGADGEYTFNGLTLAPTATYQFVCVREDMLNSDYVGYTYAFGKSATLTVDDEAKSITGGLLATGVAVDLHNSKSTTGLNFSTTPDLGSYQDKWSPILTDIKISTLPIPEPATATLSLLALAGLAMRRRRK